MLSVIYCIFLIQKTFKTFTNLTSNSTLHWEASWDQIGPSINSHYPSWPLSGLQHGHLQVSPDHPKGRSLGLLGNQIKCYGEYTHLLHADSTGVPQDSILCTLLFFLYTSSIMGSYPHLVFVLQLYGKCSTHSILIQVRHWLASSEIQIRPC